MTPNQTKENADGVFFLGLLLICAMIAALFSFVEEFKARKARQQQFVEQHLEYYMAMSQYRKKGVGNNIFSWMPADPIHNASFVVEENGDRVLLVGVLPSSTKDKIAIKVVKTLYPGKTVEFHPDFQKVKKTAFL